MYREGSYLQATVKNPVRTNDVRWRTNDVRWRTNDVRWREHGASSIEKAIRFLE